MLMLRIAQGAKLTRAVASLICMAPQPPQAAFMFSPEGVALQTSDPNGIVTAVLGFRDSNCLCSINGSAWVNLSALHNIIVPALDEDAITIATSGWGQALRFTLENFVSPGVEQLGSVDFIERIPHANDIPESRFRYDVVIEIPSQKFRQILMTLVNDTEALSVSVHVRSEKVVISSENEEIELTKENGDHFSIVGVQEEENPAQPAAVIKFPIGSSTIRASILEASELSPSVRVFVSSSLESPRMLNFRVPTIGNLNYYFVRPRMG